MTKMKKSNYSDLNEVIYGAQLENGLSIFMHPRIDYHKTYAVMATEYGSIDLTFKHLGEKDYVTSPQGVAHFLEHKLFEKEMGDVIDSFTENGAYVNAFTSYTQTAYYFSGADLFHDNLNLLLDFVQSPYFDEESVEKEKPIIAQEILMYDDSPEWKIQELLLKSLYPKHPIRYDIAGTVDSIQTISAQTLYDCYTTFYHPKNMTLVISGHFDVNETLAWIERNQSQKKFMSLAGIERHFPTEDLAQIRHQSSLEMEVERPQILLGVRGNQPHPAGREALRWQLMIQLALELLFGPTSTHYEHWYRHQVIDQSFSYSYQFNRSYDYLSIGGQTSQPGTLAEGIREILVYAGQDENMTEEHLTTIVRRLRGQLIHSLNSLEYIALSFLELKEEGTTLFDQLAILSDIHLEDIQQAITQYVDEDLMSLATILPRS